MISRYSTLGKIRNKSSDEAEPTDKKDRHVATPKGLGKKSSLFPAESSDEEPACKKGQRVATPKGLGKKCGLFLAESSEEEQPAGKKSQHVGPLFTSADHDLLIRIEKRLEQIVF